MRTAGGEQRLVVGEVAIDGPPEPGQIPTLAESYGLQFGEPDWLPGLISRYGLTPPG